MRKSLQSRTWPVFVIGLGSLLALLFLPESPLSDAPMRSTAKSARSSHPSRRHRKVSRRSNGVCISRASPSGSHCSTPRPWRHAVPRDRGRRARGDQPRARQPSPAWHGSQRRNVPAARVGVGTVLVRDSACISVDARGARDQGHLLPARAAASPSPDDPGYREFYSNLSDRSYQRQYEEVTNSQREFRDDIERIVAVAFFWASSSREEAYSESQSLEERSERERQKAEAAEEKLRSLSTSAHARAGGRTKIHFARAARRSRPDANRFADAGCGADRSRHDEPAFAEHLGEAKALAERNTSVGSRPCGGAAAVRPRPGSRPCPPVAGQTLLTPERPPRLRSPRGRFR